ncbi:MAG: DNA mismatch repair endonuclease MutL [Deltaproteobacteria bacterium]|jgi:DNA mismatch repair protein MutL|nr:DNA mismatch repair endonuclease MutL [Deltaproteobacteria bacterium]
MASRIKLLPENLINRIAAGEVVERPASVLKELLENSLDAGATRIEVDIESGGKKLIRVADNGHGLNREELFLCLERHATSKLSADSDLFSISTLGFRGEALPSIASVSKLTIVSQPENESGHKLKVEGGKILDLSPAPTNQGTVIEVRDLFFNVPARRKFLKTDATETAHLVEATQRYALSRTDLRLKLRDHGREILSVDEHNDSQARAIKILGRDLASKLLPFAQEKDDLKIGGFLCAPEAAKSGSNLFVFVSGRPVRDKLINKAIIQGYGRALPQGRFPAGVVFIELDPSRVDVNVHPAKTEVRFREPGLIFDFLSRAVSLAIDVSPIARSPKTEPQYQNRYQPRSQTPEITRSHYGLPDSLAPDRDNANFPALNGPAPSAQTGENQSGHGLEKSSPRLTRFSMGRAPLGDRLERWAPLPTPPWMSQNDAPDQAGAPDQTQDPGQIPGPAHGPEIAQTQVAIEAAEAASDSIKVAENAKVLAQLRQSYILAEGPDALYIIDQHAAHERVLFNSMKETLHKHGLPSQGLVLPETLELGHQESLAVEKLLKHLSHLGFNLEPFGDRVWSLRGIPSALEVAAAKEALLEILASAKKRLRDLDGAGLKQIATDLSDTWLYGLACRAAVKAGDPLTQMEMEALIKSLSELGSGGYCPHGRPSVIVLKLIELEKRFGRT